MTDAKRIAVETVWVPGHAGWQGQRRSTTGLIALGVLLAAARASPRRRFLRPVLSDPARWPGVSARGVGQVSCVVAQHLDDDAVAAQLLGRAGAFVGVTAQSVDVRDDEHVARLQGADEA